MTDLLSVASPLPLDILHLILDEISYSTRTCLSICLVSHQFLFEARFLLYSKVTVSDSSVCLFCRTITENPRISDYVQELSLGIPNSQTREELEQIALCLRCLKCLRALELMGRPVSLDSATAHIAWSPVINYKLMHWEHSDETWMLKGCTFKLQDFSSGFAFTSDLVQFLREQPGIKAWTHVHRDDTAFQLPEDLLPELTTFRTIGHRLENRKQVKHILLNVVIPFSAECNQAFRMLTLNTTESDQ